MIDVLTIGETMGAIRSEGVLGVGRPPSLSVAGAESNVAIGLARLGHRSAWASVLGDDAIGDLIVRTCSAEGVDVAAVRRLGGRPSGILVSQQRPMGRARVDYHRTASAFTAIDTQDVLAALERSPRILHLTGITPALGPGPARAVTAAVREARSRGITVSFDVNFRSRLWDDTGAARLAFAELARHADVVFGGVGELALVVPEGTAPGELPAAVLSLGAREVVVKLGGDGARGVTSEQDVSAPAHQVDVLDPIGAGDAFVAGYLSGALDGLDLTDRLARANVCGALAVATPGDWEGLPHRPDLDLLDTAPGDVQR